MLYEYAGPSIPIYQIVLLSLITLITLLFPFIFRLVNDYIEYFFLVMGVAALTISGGWSVDVLLEALKAPVTIGSAPIGIFQVVLLFGLLIHYFDHRLYGLVTRVYRKLRPGLFLFLTILLLGLLSSVLSVIATSVILAELLIILPFSRQDKVKIAVISCFAIGLGAGLTPIGEPLSTILVYKLSGPPYNAGFFFPLTTLGLYILPGIILIAIAGSLLPRCGIALSEAQSNASESVKTVVIRSFKVYIFIFALILLGAGLGPLFTLFLGMVPAWALYWINLLSSFLDNATLTAIEISPGLQLSQIIGAVIALLISGGMLIPGNIPNIVAAGRLKITMKEWALIGVPVGLVMMAIYFVVLLPVLFS